jgi:hypothetical protein
VSLSVPLRTPSVQLGAAHKLDVQIELAQSLFAVQPDPAGQPAGQLLPQSTPVSVPFFVASVHVGD